MTDQPGPLAAVNLLDLTDERAIYGAKLLADLGAETARVEPPSGDPLRRRGPFLDDVPGPVNSLWHAYFASNRHFVTVDAQTEDGRRQLRKLLDWADIVIESGMLAEAEIPPARAVEDRPALVVVHVSSFGPDGPWRDYLAPDLVAGALGGSVATTGDADTPPLRLFGDMHFVVSGAYAAIGALAALRHARETGEGQLVDVPVHETIVSALEHVLMWVWYHNELPQAQGPVLPRRGSLHWSNAYEVMAARGGSIMMTPTPDLQRQLAWLAEEGAAEDLLDPKWMEPANLPGLIARVMEVLRDWVATKDVEPFFHEAQERHHPFGWVMPPERVATNPQLDARDWWAEYTLGRSVVRGPGTPYRFLDTPWAIRRPYAPAGADTRAVLRAIGWED